ncbi:hypothetical protein [Labilibaculum euxinus]
MNIEKRILFLCVLLICSLTVLKAQLKSDSLEDLKFGFYGINIVHLKDIDSYKVNLCIKNNTQKIIELNKVISTSNNIESKGVSYELQVYKDKSFIPYDLEKSFNVVDVNFTSLLKGNIFIEMNGFYSYSFNPFIVYTPSSSGVFRVRCFYGKLGSYKYSKWFYIYVYSKKKELGGLLSEIESISKLDLMEVH